MASEYQAVPLTAAASLPVTHPMSDGMASTSLVAHIFSTPWAAFNLNWKPDIPQISVDLLAEMYGLPDLHPALVDLFSEGFEGPSLHHIGGR